MSFRRERAAHDVRARLAAILELEVRDPRVRGVHLTAVELAPDFSYARVFYRTLGDPAAAGEGLARAKGFVRRRLAEQISLRRIPELDFRYDESVDQGARVDEILREIGRERGSDEPEEE